MQKKIFFTFIFLVFASACANKTDKPLGETVTIDDSVPGKISFNPAQINLGEYILSEESEYVLTIKNSGKLDTEGLSFADFPEESKIQIKDDSNTCTSSLSKGDTCSVTLVFSPDVIGVYDYHLYFFYNNGIERVGGKLKLTATVGEIASLEVQDTSALDFGVHETGVTLQKTITITNAGGLTAKNIDESELGDGDFSYVGGAFPGTGGNCSTQLASGASCTLKIRFDPLTQKFHSKQFTLNYYNGDDDDVLNVNVQGIADTIAAKIIALGSSSYNFGNSAIGSLATKSITIINAGYLDADTITFPNNTPFNMVSHNCPATLPVGVSCEVIMGFTPAVSGLVAGNFQVSYNNQQAVSVYSLPVSGTGITPAEFGLINDAFSVVPAADFDIKAVGSTTQLNFYLKNTGSLKASAINLQAISAPFSLITTDCGVELLPNATCGLTLEFRPTVTALASSNLNIEFHNGGGVVTQSIPLIGDGQNLGVLEVNIGAFYHFGTHTVGDTQEVSITLANPGNIAATNINPTNLIAPYLFKGGTFPGTGGTCPAGPNFSLASLATCTFIVEFPPTSGFSFSNLIFSYHDGNGLKNLLTQVRGIGQTPALLVADNADFDFDFGYRSALEPTVIRSFQITNDGEATATNLAYSIVTGTHYAYAGGSFPGASGDATGDCSNTLQGGATCTVILTFTSPGVGTWTDNYSIDYDNGLTTTNSVIPITITIGNYAKIAVSQDIYAFPPTAKTATRQYTWTVTNSGPTNATGLTATFGSGSQFSIDASSTCGAVLNALSSCDYIINYSWPFNGSHVDLLTLDYNDGSPQNKDFELELSGTVDNPASLEFLAVNTNNDPYDYDLTVVNTAKTNYFLVRNKTSVEATAIALSGLAAPFVVVANNCPDPIPGYASCSIQVNFTPPGIGVLYTDTLIVAYHNGLIGQSVSRVMKGTGEPPLHTHGDWTEIYAIGDAVNTSDVSSVDKKVRLKWNVMVPDSSTIGSYSVFRRTENTEFNFSSPLATGIATGSRQYTDTSVSHATTYYYTVRPIISGFPSRSHSSFSEIRVITPPQNMALAHRRMINQDICAKLGQVSDKANHNRCNYAGLGSDSGYYDIGKDILVDRFETGLDGTARTGQKPYILTQIAANNNCKAKTVAIDGQSSSSNKKLMSRKDFIAVSSWPSTLSAADIQTLESGTDSSNNCNGNGANTENSGVNTSCVSRYGIMDLVGNAWEWTSDRVLDGVGVTDLNLKLDESNTEFDNYNMSLFPNSAINLFACFNIAMGIGHPLEGFNCGDSVDMATFGGVNTHSDYQFTPSNTDIKFLLNGGSHLNATTYPGRYTSAWVPFNFGSGFHCSVDAGY